MTTHDATDDAGSDRPDVGQDPMHPHPQDEASRGEDDRSDDERDDNDDEAAATDPDRASPGIAATRRMDEPGDVPEPNEPG